MMRERIYGCGEKQKDVIEMFDDERPRYGMQGRKGRGKPLTDEERLKQHFGKDWKNHTIAELPQRQHKNQNTQGRGLRRQQ